MKYGCLVALWLPYAIALESYTAQFRVEPHVSIPENVMNWTPFTAPTLAICALSCLGNSSCILATYNDQKMLCNLYPCLPNHTKTGILTSSLLIKTELKMENIRCVYQDCQDAFEKNDVKQNDVYKLMPSDSWGQVIEAVCQFDFNSGWTVIQRRLDGSEDFYRYWNDYVDGFGNRTGEYWIGLDSIYWLTRVNRRLSIFLEDHDGETRTANYSSFNVDGASSKYKLHISGYSGTAGDSLNHAGGLSYRTGNGRYFSTRDSDNDGNSGTNCAHRDKGGWWYNSCKYSNLNGIWYPGGATTSSLDAASWYTWRWAYYSYKTVYMRISRQ